MAHWTSGFKGIDVVFIWLELGRGFLPFTARWLLVEGPSVELPVVGRNLAASLRRAVPSPVQHRELYPVLCDRTRRKVMRESVGIRGRLRIRHCRSRGVGHRPSSDSIQELPRASGAAEGKKKKKRHSSGNGQ